SVQQIGLVLRQLPPGVQIKLHRAHQLSRSHDRHDQRVLRVPARVQAWRRVLVEPDDKWPHHGKRGAEWFLVDLAHAATGADGQQDEGDDQQDRDDEQYARGFQVSCPSWRLSSDRLTRQTETWFDKRARVRTASRAERDKDGPY